MTDKYELDTGRTTVAVEVEDDGTVFMQVDETGEYMQGNTYMTPDQAREVAAELLKAAAQAESRND